MGLKKLQTLLAMSQQPLATTVHQMPPSPAPASGSQLVLCPRGCGAQLNPHKVGRHLQRVHPAIPVRQPPPKTETARKALENARKALELRRKQLENAPQKTPGESFDTSYQSPRSRKKRARLKVSNGLDWHLNNDK